MRRVLLAACAAVALSPALARAQTSPASPPDGDAPATAGPPATANGDVPPPPGSVPPPPGSVPPPPGPAPQPVDASVPPPPGAPAVPRQWTTGEPEEAPPRKTWATLKIDAGYTLRWLHAVGAQGLDLRLGVGGRSADFAHHASFALFYGATEAGLRAYDFKLGYNGDARVAGPFWLGLGVELGYVWVRRATVDARMYTFGVGGYAHALVELFQFGERDRSSLHLGARMTGGIHFGSAALWGPSVFLGMRL